MRLCFKDRNKQSNNNNKEQSLDSNWLLLCFVSIFFQKLIACKMFRWVTYTLYLLVECLALLLPLFGLKEMVSIH